MSVGLKANQSKHGLSHFQLSCIDTKMGVADRLCGTNRKNTMRKKQIFRSRLLEIKMWDQNKNAEKYKMVLIFPRSGPRRCRNALSIIPNCGCLVTVELPRSDGEFLCFAARTPFKSQFSFLHVMTLIMSAASLLGGEMKHTDFVFVSFRVGTPERLPVSPQSKQICCTSSLSESSYLNGQIIQL